MANNVAATVTGKRIKGFDGSVHSFVLDTGDDSKPLENLTNKKNISVQVIGTIAGSTVTVQGSNDGTNWATLKDTQGADIALTAVGLKTVVDRPVFMRAIISGGTAADMTVIFAVAGD